MRLFNNYIINDRLSILKLFAIFLGLLSGCSVGCLIGFFSNNFQLDIFIGGFISGVITAIFFKNEILEFEDIGTSEEKFFDKDENYKSRIIQSNSWVFWISSWVTALIISVIEKLSYFQVFVACGLSLLIAILFTLIGSKIANR